MWYGLRRGGKMVSLTTVLPDPIPDGLIVETIGPDFPDGKAWDEGALAFVDVRAATIVPSIDFLRRFTVGERVAIRAASSTDPVCLDFLEMLAAADRVDLGHPDVDAGIQYLLKLGLITSPRAAEILGR